MMTDFCDQRVANTSDDWAQVLLGDIFGLLERRRVEGKIELDISQAQKCQTLLQALEASVAHLSISLEAVESQIEGFGVIRTLMLRIRPAVDCSLESSIWENSYSKQEVELMHSFGDQNARIDKALQSQQLPIQKTVDNHLELGRYAYFEGDSMVCEAVSLAIAENHQSQLTIEQDLMAQLENLRKRNSGLQQEILELIREVNRLTNNQTIQQQLLPTNYHKSFDSD